MMTGRTFYDAYPMPAPLRRTGDVYARVAALGIALGSADEWVTSLAGINIAYVVFTDAGLVYISGAAGGDHPMTDDPATITQGKAAGAAAADKQIRWLHWALTCGGEGGDLNAVLYTVKALGLVVSDPRSAFRQAPEVVNGYSARWHSVFGGGLSDSAADGVDPSGFAGVHARSALGGLDGGFAQESEMIVAIPPSLARAIIANRGWAYPLPPAMLNKVRANP
jgi:hypothetical protein